MYRTQIFLSLSLFSAVLLTGCLHSKKQAPASTVIPIGKIPVKKIIQKEVLKKVETSEQTTGGPSLSPPKEQKEAPEKPIEIAVIVSYFRFLNSLPEKALKQEHARTQKEFAEDSTAINRLRLAMLLGFTNTRHRDTQRSLDLLNRYLEDPNTLDPILRDFSFLLASFVEQFKNQDKTYKTMQHRLKKERTENKKLKKMIEALKTIEKNLVERETAEKK